MEWSDLRIFLNVARHGSLSAASRRLGLSQPTVSRRLEALESSLGRTLVQRTPGGMVLTEEGTRLVARVERMELEALDIERQPLKSGSEWVGRLKVGASDWFAARVLPPVVAAFARAHPRVSVEVLTDHRLPSLNRRQNDVSFRIVPFVEPDVVARRLLTMEYGVYASPDYPTWSPGGEGATVLTLPDSLGHIADVAWIRHRLPRATPGPRSNNREVLAAFCAQGLGLAVLPRPLGDQWGLVLVDLGEAPPSIDTWIGYHRDQADSPLVREFVQVAFRHLH